MAFADPGMAGDGGGADVVAKGPNAGQFPLCVWRQQFDLIVALTVRH